MNPLFKKSMLALAITAATLPLSTWANTHATPLPFTAAELVRGTVPAWSATASSAVGPHTPDKAIDFDTRGKKGETSTFWRSHQKDKVWPWLRINLQPGEDQYYILEGFAPTDKRADLKDYSITVGKIGTTIQATVDGSTLLIDQARK